MKFSFIAKHRSIWAISWMCEALSVSRSGLHAWLRRPPSQRARDDEGIGAKVRASFVASARTYARRVWRDVLAKGAQKTWRRLDGQNQLPKLIADVAFKDGIEVSAKQSKVAA